MRASNVIARRNRAFLKRDDLLYLGDISNIPVKFISIDHCNCNRKRKQYLGISYKFLDGTFAYRERYMCVCCEYGHQYLPGVDNKTGNFVGLICSLCGMPGPDMEHPEHYKDNIYDRAQG